MKDMLLVMVLGALGLLFIMCPWKGSFDVREEELEWRRNFEEAMLRHKEQTP